MVNLFIWIIINQLSITVFLWKNREVYCVGILCSFFRMNNIQKDEQDDQIQYEKHDADSKKNICHVFYESKYYIYSDHILSFPI